MRVSKEGCAITCQRCFQIGHNKKTCKNEPVAPPPKIAKRKGRPRKVQDGETGATTSGTTARGDADATTSGTTARGHAASGNTAKKRGRPRKVQTGASGSGNEAGVQTGASGSGNEAGVQTGASASGNEAGVQTASASALRPTPEFAIGGTYQGFRAGVGLGVSSVGSHRTIGVPKKKPNWWGTGVCICPNTGETFLGGSDSVPVAPWPPGVAMPSASEMAAKRTQENTTASEMVASMTQENTAASEMVASMTQENTAASEMDVAMTRPPLTAARHTRTTAARTPEKDTSQPERRSPRIVKMKETTPKRRNPSERIIKKKLGMHVDGPGSSSKNVISL